MGEEAAGGISSEEQNGLPEKSASAEHLQINHNDSVKMNGKTKSNKFNNDVKTKRKRPFGATLGKRFRLLFKPWKWRKKGTGKRAQSLNQRSLSGMYFNQINLYVHSKVIFLVSCWF